MTGVPTMPSAAKLSYPGADDITRVELDNGITILARPNFTSQSVVISGYLYAGGLYDPQDKLGLADFCASALMRGTTRRSFHQIFDELESVGASLQINSGTHTTGFGGQALAEDLDSLLDILADSLRQPSFPPDQVERLRAQLLTNLAILAQDTSHLAQRVFEQIIYPGHPYSQPEEGYPETVQAIRPIDLQDFHRRVYGPMGMVLVVVGAVEPDLAVEKVAKVLGDWRNPAQVSPPGLPPVSLPVETTRRFVELPGKVQVDLVLGAAGPARKDYYYQAANLGNIILGQFGLMGRIGEVVREQAGLAYSVHSSLGGGFGPGPWELAAGVAPQAVDQVIELLIAELRRFISEPVSEAELADVQSLLIGSLPLSLEANAGVAGALLNLERYQLGLNYYRNYPEMIRAISREDILTAARKYLDPDHLGIGIAGTAAQQLEADR